MSVGLEIVGVGIDLVSRNRIRRLLHDHPTESFSRLLTSSEQSVFLNSIDPAKFFARHFAAKEAYFKARGGHLLTESDFGEIEVVEESEGKFHIGGNFENEGIFFETPDGLGARVLIKRKSMNS